MPPRRKCKLADSEYRDTDLRKYCKLIVNTINATVSGKNPRVFEDIKHTKENGAEYWLARELAIVLDYTKWEKFNKVIKRAMIACENSGHDISHDFPEVRKIVKAGATKKPGLDYELTRYACYLSVQNGDSRKEYCPN